MFSASQCNDGTRIRTLLPTNELKETQGRVEVYRHANGVRCAIAYHGASSRTQVRLDVRNVAWELGAYDSGAYTSYAGGIGTNGCIVVSASISLGTGRVNQFRAPSTSIC